jgi:hypothetical protein
MEPDASRAVAQLALLAEMAAQRGMELTLEFAPPHSINTGEGDLPLRELLAVVPKNVRVGLEIPMQARIGADASLEALVARAVAACP